MKKKFITVLRLIILGIIVGIFIAGYQFLAHLAISKSKLLLGSQNLIWIITILCSLICLFGLMMVNKKNPGYYGSGIPQLEGYHRGWYQFSPFKMLIFIIINSLFAFFGGFLLGSEGPSISIGSSIGLITNRAFKDESKEEVAIGGSAGFGCAFASPLAGLCHLIEENKHIVSFRLIFKGILVIGISFIVCYLLYPHSLLPNYTFPSLPFKYYLVLFLVVMLSVLLGKLYIYLIVKVKDFTKNKKIMFYLTPVLLIVFMVIRRLFPVLSGNGMESLNLEVFDYGLLIILGVLLFRLLATAFSVSSNVSGGVVLPMLAIGSLTAMSVVKGACYLDTNINQYLGLFVICGMLVVFATVTNAPITAFILGLKCAPFKVIALPLFLSIAIGIIPFYLFKWINLYHQLEQRLPGYIKH